MKIIYPLTDFVVVQRNNIMEEVNANIVWILITPRYLAASSGKTLPKNEHPLVIARLGISLLSRI